MLKAKGTKKLFKKSLDNKNCKRNICNNFKRQLVHFVTDRWRANRWNDFSLLPESPCALTWETWSLAGKRKFLVKPPSFVSSAGLRIAPQQELLIVWIKLWMIYDSTHSSKYEYDTHTHTPRGKTGSFEFDTSSNIPTICPPFVL